MYELETIFQVHFCIHLLADVLIELNRLNQKFQDDHIDITSIGTTLDVTISMLRKRFLGDIFGVGAMHISSFLIKVKGETLKFADNICMVHLHPLRFESFPKIQKSGTLDDCILLGKCFVMKAIESIDRRFTDLPIFNATKFFSPHHYYEEMDDRDSNKKMVGMFM